MNAKALLFAPTLLLAIAITSGCSGSDDAASAEDNGALSDAVSGSAATTSIAGAWVSRTYGNIPNTKFSARTYVFVPTSKGASAGAFFTRCESDAVAAAKELRQTYPDVVADCGGAASAAGTYKGDFDQRVAVASGMYRYTGRVALTYEDGHVETVDVTHSGGSGGDDGTDKYDWNLGGFKFEHQESWTNDLEAPTLCTIQKQPHTLPDGCTYVWKRNSESHCMFSVACPKAGLGAPCGEHFLLPQSEVPVSSREYWLGRDVIDGDMHDCGAGTCEETYQSSRSRKKCVNVVDYGAACTGSMGTEYCDWKAYLVCGDAGKCVHQLGSSCDTNKPACETGSSCWDWTCTAPSQQVP